MTRIATLAFALACLTACPDDPKTEDMSPQKDATTDTSEDMPQTDADMSQDMPVDTGTQAVFDPKGEGFFDLPFPSDARRDADGKIKLHTWAAATRSPLVKLWFDAEEELLDGWSLTPGVAVNFTGPLDPATFPASWKESVTAEPELPSIFMMDVDPDSQEKGTLFALECTFNLEEGRLRIANQLSCKPPLGVVRRPNTTYAFVITNRVKDTEGNPILPAPATKTLIAGTDVEGTHKTIAAAPYAQAATYLKERGLATEDIASLTLITTGDPTRRLKKVQAFYDALPEPSISAEDGIKVVRTYDTYTVLEVYYEVPIVQEGDFPYDAPPAGKLKLNAQGEIEQVGTQKIRAYITLPRTPMPEGGYPLMTFLHGSGGVAEQLLDRGAFAPNGDAPAPGKGPAEVLARYGVAGSSFDFQFHGMRFDPPDTSGLKLYNLLGNPRATIDNFNVAAAEVTLHARLMKGLTFRPEDIQGLVDQGLIDLGSATDGLVRFNDDRFSAMGQSMGSTILAPAMAIDKITDAAILSGSGGSLIEIAITGTQPVELVNLLRVFMKYKKNEVMDQYDPLLHALQHLWDFVDPIVYARYNAQEPWEGIPAKHVLQHSGLTDGYFSPDSRAGLGLALGAGLATPVLEDRALSYLELIGLEQPLSLPVQGNAQGITNVTVQYEPSVLDGHNVAYQREDTKAQYGCFVKTVRAGEAPRLLSPENASPEKCP